MRCLHCIDKLVLPASSRSQFICKEDMAITSSLSCVDYLSIKFGCQNLNSDKEIYNHLSQEWFRRPFIKEFSFAVKNESWTNTFTDSNERGRMGSKKLKPSLTNKRQKTAKVPMKNSKNRGQSGNLDIMKDTKDASHHFSEQVIFDIKNSTASQILNSTPFDRNEALDNAKNESNLISSNDDECFSESELELMQIYGREIGDDYQGSIEPVPLIMSRKRSSTEYLDRAENENLAKRMRPSIDIAKMHQSRILSRTVFEDSDELFVPISLEAENL